MHASRLKKWIYFSTQAFEKQYCTTFGLDKEGMFLDSDLKQIFLGMNFRWCKTWCLKTHFDACTGTPNLCLSWRLVKLRLKAPAKLPFPMNVLFSKSASGYSWRSLNKVLLDSPKDASQDSWESIGFICLPQYHLQIVFLQNPLI